MKSIFLTLLTSLTLLVLACNTGKETSEYTRIVFNADSLRVISSSVNKKLETMSLLYGNDKAYRAMMDSSSTHMLGEVYKFVTWRYHDNPFFYGSKINGELLSVESIYIRENGAVDYKIEKGSPGPVNNSKLNQTERIRYILAYKPSPLP
ncbi:MAG TPA: hypothetical protein VN040_07310 [Pseudosphingobacterium sp.]|nr:hypothetical protein [Pseudosphingobacterium sp.]